MQSLFPVPLALFNCNVAVDGKIRESLSLATRVRPFHVQPVEPGSLAQAQDHARIVRRKITPSSHFPLVAHQIVALITKFRANSIYVCFAADQPHA